MLEIHFNLMKYSWNFKKIKYYANGEMLSIH